MDSPRSPTRITGAWEEARRSHPFGAPEPNAVTNSSDYKGKSAIPREWHRLFDGNYDEGGVVIEIAVAEFPHCFQDSLL